MTSTQPIHRGEQNDEKLPGTDMKEWLEKRRSEGGLPHALEGSEGEIRIHLSNGEQSAWQHRNGSWVAIPIEEALAHASDKFGGSR